MKTALFAVLLLASVSARAEDLTGRLGVGGVIGADEAVGSRWFAHSNDLGWGLGAWARYGLSPRWGARLSYDNLDFTRGPSRLEPMLLSAVYSLAPDSSWNPNIHAGVGAAVARRIPIGKPTVFAGSVGLGVDKFIASRLTVGAALDYFAAAGTKSPTHTDPSHVFRLAATLGLWFGGAKPAPKAAAAPAPAPAPVVAAPAPAKVPAPAPALPQEKVTIALDLQFDTAKDVVKPQYDEQLKKVADFLKTYPDSKAEIEGHTDNAGAAAYNTALSQRRADAVRQALIDRFGADGSRLTAKGYGPDKPASDNSTPAGRAQNRRVAATFTAIKQP